MGRKAVSKGKARGCHDAKRNGAAPPEFSVDTHGTELLPKNASKRTYSF